MRGHAVQERRSPYLPTLFGTSNLRGWYRADRVTSTGPGPSHVTVAESFSEADGTNLNGKWTEGGGKTWLVRNGTGEVNGGKLRGLTFTPTLWATIDTGVPDFDMSMDLTYYGGLDGFAFRTVDATNYLRLGVTTSGDQVNIIRCIAGTESTVASWNIGITDGETATMRLVVAGNSIKYYANGVLRIDTTDSNHMNATNHGVVLGDSRSRIDNFSIAGTRVISTWEDQSGLSADLTATGSARPTMHWNKVNGLPMVEFDGVDDYIGRGSDPFGASSQLFVVAIWRIAGRAVIGSFPDKHAFTDTNAFWRQSNGTGLSVTNTVTPPLNRPVIMGHRFDAGAAGRIITDWRQTGETGTSQSVGTSSAWGIGGSNGSGGPPPNTFFSGWVGEVLIYNRELTVLERAGVIEYLAHKWFGRSWA